MDQEELKAIVEALNARYVRRVEHTAEGELTRVVCMADVRSAESLELIKQRIIPMVVSSETVDTYRSIILQDGIDLDTRFLKNPIFVWSHPIGGGGCDTPGISRILGRAVKVIRDGSRTIMHFKFLPASVNPDAEMAFQMYLDGSLNACSVGLLNVTEIFSGAHEEQLGQLPVHARAALDEGLADSIITKGVLMEVSAVFIGANPDALQIRSAGSDGSRSTDIKDVVDRRLEVRERAFCTRATKMMALLDSKLAALDALTARLEAILVPLEAPEPVEASPVDRTVAKLKAQKHDFDAAIRALKPYL
jgi:hypothetical protein